VNHRWLFQGKIIGVIVIIFSQALALILLLIQRNKRSRAEDESQRLRDDLTHVSRVLSMGEIATSLAHEINQLRTPIKGQRFPLPCRFIWRIRDDIL
jgi:hypothetical protein